MGRTRDILALRQRTTLRAFTSSETLLALDYDGTLAPIDPDPARVRMRTRTRALLIQVARRYPTIVVSGRPAKDVSRRVAGIPVRLVYGNFGAEPAAGRRAPNRVRHWVRRLSAALESHAGIVIEDKGYSVTVHYRHAPNRARALADIHDAVACLRGVRVLGGVCAVSLLPADGPDKGVVLNRARRLLRCEMAIYVGDDDTDEDAFASGHPERLLSVRIGVSSTSRARYCLRSQADIDRFLRRLLILRA